MASVPKDCAIAAGGFRYPGEVQCLAWREFDGPKVPNAFFLQRLRQGVAIHTRLVNGTVVIWRAKP